MNNQFVYLDHAATTSLRPQVLEAIKSAIDNYTGRNGLVAEKCDSNVYGKRCCELYQYEED